MLTEPSYTVRLEFVDPIQGADFYADYFTMTSVVATDRSSWGEIKDMYK